MALAVGACSRVAGMLHLLCNGSARSEVRDLGGEHGLELRLDLDSGRVFYLRENEPAYANRQPDVADVTAEVSATRIRLVSTRPPRAYVISRADGTYEGATAPGEEPAVSFSGRCFSPRGEAF